MLRAPTSHPLQPVPVTLSDSSAPRVRIRPALPADATAILALEAQFDSDRMSPRSVRHLLRSASACVSVAEAADGGAMFGDLVLLTRRGSRSARIYSVVVAPEARGQRIGERLVQAAEAEALRRGCTAMQLEVKVDNTAARALYARLGYRQTAALPAYYEDGSDGLRLTRALR